MTDLPAALAPYLTIECPDIMAATQDGADAGVDPDRTQLVVELRLTPVAASGVAGPLDPMQLPSTLAQMT